MAGKGFLLNKVSGKAHSLPVEQVILFLLNKSLEKPILYSVSWQAKASC